MDCIDRFKRMNSINGTTDKEYYINVGKDTFEKYVSTIPNSVDFKINDETVTYTGALQSQSKDGVKGDGKLLLVSLDSQLKVGDYVYLQNSSDISNRIWLVTGLESEVLHSHRKFLIKPCNYVVKFVSDGIVYSFNAIVVNALMYTLGTTTDQYTMYGNSKLSVLCGKNTTTELMNVDMRIICDGLAWKLSSVNRISVDGVPIIGCMSLMFGQDEIGEYDDLENQIADRYSQSSPKPNYTFDFPSELTVNKNAVLSLDTTLFKVFNNGIEITNPTLSIITTSPLFTNTLGVLTAITEGETTVNIKFIGEDGEHLIPLLVKISVPAETIITTYNIIENINSVSINFNVRKYQIGTFDAIKLENGNIVNGALFDFTLSNYTLTATTSSIVISSVTDTTIKIKNNTATNGSVTINAIERGTLNTFSKIITFTN